MPTHLSDDFKLAIVKQVTNGTSIYSLSKQFQISSRSIRRWTEKYQQTNSVSREKREVEAYKVYDDVHVKYAIAYLRKHPTTTIKTVLSTKILPENYRNYFHYAYSVSQSPMCKRNKSTREKKPGTYKKGNKDKTIL